MAMIILCPAFILLAIVSTAFSRCSRIPQEYNCAWERNSCSQGRIFLAQCNCDCGLGNNMLCCDPSILEEYHYPIWRGTAPLCNAECPRSCEYDESLCWWQSKCGNGSRCLSGNKVLCGERRRKSWWPFLNKVKYQGLKKPLMNLERPADRFAGYNEFKGKDVRLQDNY